MCGSVRDIFELDQIQYDRLSVIVNFNMPDKWQIAPDSLDHHYKTKCAGRDMP